MRYVQPLTNEQQELLEKTMQEDTSFRARSRAHSLLLSAEGTTIKAIAKAYEAIDKIDFDHMFFRRDIGQKALKKVAQAK